MSDEIDLVAKRYALRDGPGVGDRYSTMPAVWLSMQGRQRALIRLLNKNAAQDLMEIRVLEIGSGGGENLLEILRLGFIPENLIANELLPDRVALARRNLPAACQPI
jgi:SAM-dependent methyltransferase